MLYTRHIALSNTNLHFNQITTKSALTLLFLMIVEIKYKLITTDNFKANKKFEIQSVKELRIMLASELNSLKKPV